MKYHNKLCLPLISTFLLTQTLQASSDANITQNDDWVILPYAFSSDFTGLAGGLGFIKQGLLQPQTTLATSMFMGTTQEIMTQNQPREVNFNGGFLSFSNYKLPFSKRVFFSILGLKSYFPKQRYYFDGKNDSKQNKGFTTSGESNFFNTTLTYVLPIGEGLENPETHYKLKDGFVQNREDFGNGIPFITGRTSVGIKTFYQKDSFENWSASTASKDEATASIPVWYNSGLRFFLAHDNTDFNLNPSRGYSFELQYSKDFGKLNSLQTWDFLEFKFNKYYTLDNFYFTKQNVLALSFWTGYSFSWDTNKQIVPEISSHRPPPWEGARLGGFNRLRGYENNRFSDKAVIYGTAEYRMILHYNPLKKNSLMPVAVDWFQVVAFIEAGRVHERYNIDLLSDLKYNAGVSLRAMVAKLPIRFDIAYGKEGTNMWVMIQHPFDF